MSSHNSSKDGERVGSARKRISTLNDHEDHLLRRRIHTYQKMHDKGIAEVASQLEEIRDSMKALVTDPLYGTHALINTGIEHESSYKSPVINQRRKSILRRTQSFPELLDSSSDDSVRRTNPSPFPALKMEHLSVHHAAPLVTHKRFGEAKSSSIGSHFVNPSIQSGKEALNWHNNEHKKLERSKTAPVALLQPLLRTTPEMMRKKIHISTSNKLSTEPEVSARRGVSPRFVDPNAMTHNASHLQTNQPDMRNHIPARDIASSDSLLRGQETSNSLYKSRLQPGKPIVKAYPTNMVPAEDEQNDAVSVSLQAVKNRGHKSPLKGISRPLNKLKQELFKANCANEKEADEVDDLKNCRYLRFTKESQESNRI